MERGRERNDTYGVNFIYPSFNIRQQEPELYFQLRKYEEPKRDLLTDQILAYCSIAPIGECTKKHSPFTVKKQNFLEQNTAPNCLGQKQSAERERGRHRISYSRVVPHHPLIEPHCRLHGEDFVAFSFAPIHTVPDSDKHSMSVRGE